MTNADSPTAGDTFAWCFSHGRLHKFGHDLPAGRLAAAL